MMSLKQLLVLSCIVVVATTMAGCTMSDDEIQAYVNSHPDEIQAYVSSHGQQISEYLQQHPEILSEITFPETTTPIVEQAIAEPVSTKEELTEAETTQTSEPTPASTETTTIPTTKPTTEVPTTTPTTVPITTQTTEPTTEVPTTTPTTVPVTTQTTEPTTLPTTEVTTEIPTTIPTTTPTTVPTPEPTPTPYISGVTGQPAIIDVNGPWNLVSVQDGIHATMTVSLNYNSPSYTGVDPYNGVAIISGEANNVAIKREDGNPVGVGSLHGTDFSYQFTWHDNLDGTYTTSSIINPLDWSDKAARTITYSVRDGTREELHFSGWPEGTYLKRG